MKKKLSIAQYLTLLLCYTIFNAGIILLSNHFYVHYIISAITSYFLSILLISFICSNFYKINILKQIKPSSLSITLIINIIILRYNLVRNYTSKTTFISISLIIGIIILVLIDIYINKKRYISIVKEKIKFIVDKINNLWNKILSTKFIKKIFIFLPNNWVAFGFLIVSIITIVNFCRKYQDDYYFYYKNLQTDGNIGQIIKPIDINIDNNNIDIDKDINISHICIRFGTYNRINNSHYKIIINNNNKTIFNKRINANSLIDGEHKCFKIGTTKSSNLKNYTIKISPDKDVKKSNAVTIFKNTKTNELSIGFAKLQSKDLNMLKYNLIIFVLIVFFLINYIINKKKLTPNKYLLIISIYMILAAIIIPAFQTPDEVAHFYRSYGISQIKFRKGIYKQLKNNYFIVPSNISCLNYTKIQMSNKVLNINDIKECALQAKNQKTFLPEIGTGALLGYIIQPIGIKIIDYFSNSPLIIFYFGRLFMLAVSFAICYYSLKKTPKYKNLFLIICTMMMFIQQMISYSYDSLLNSICILYMAYLIKLFHSDEKISIKDWLIVSILLVFILNIKIVYFPLIIFIFLIPKNKFKDGTMKNKIKFIICTVILSIALWKGFDFIINYGNNLHTRSAESIKAGKQINYLIKNPLSIIRIAINTLDSKGLFYIQGLTGFFGWFSFKVSDIFIWVYILLFTYVILSEESTLDLKRRLLILVSILTSIAGIFAAMYLFWSDYKLPYVEGVQGRYFIPLLIPLALIIIPHRKKIRINESLLYTIINIILLQFMLVIILWFY